MIATIIILCIAFYLLLIETNYLRIRLLATPKITADIRILLDDIDIDFDNSDIDFLPDYEQQLEQAIADAEYQAWLDEYHAPTYSWYPNNKVKFVDPRDKWLVIEDDLRTRRNGEALYQRNRDNAYNRI